MTTSAGRCRLCKNERPLRESHVLPHFVYRWLASSSPGRFRASVSPNRRIQDGPKMPWLCDDCEQRFSDAERPFAETIFAPLHSDESDGSPVSYASWGHYFAVSVSWRSLFWFVETAPSSHLKPSDQKRVEEALSTWGNYLLGERDDVGRFPQHAMPCGSPSSAPGAHPFISRYFERTCQIDVIASRESCVVYSKMARLLVFGILRMDKPGEWRGSRMHLLRGTFGGAKTYHLPAWMPSYWNTQAASYEAALGSLSTRQKEKIAQLKSSTDPDVLAKSGAFRAFRSDYELFGDVVFADEPSPTRQG